MLGGYLIFVITVNTNFYQFPCSLQYTQGNDTFFIPIWWKEGMLPTFAPLFWPTPYDYHPSSIFHPSLLVDLVMVVGSLSLD
jgi:hypothetical protein